MASSTPGLSAPRAGQSDKPLNLAQQVAFYFSEENLAKDMYMVSNMDQDGFVDVSVIAAFRRVRGHTMDQIVEAARGVASLEVISQNNTHRIRPRFMEPLVKKDIRFFYGIINVSPTSTLSDLMASLGQSMDSIAAHRRDPVDKTAWYLGFRTVDAVERFMKPIRERDIIVNGKPAPKFYVDTQPAVFAAGLRPLSMLAPSVVPTWQPNAAGAAGASAPATAPDTVDTAAKAAPTAAAAAAPKDAAAAAADRPATASAAAGAAKDKTVPAARPPRTERASADATATAARGRGAARTPTASPAAGVAGGRGARDKPVAGGKRDTRRDGKTGRGAAPYTPSDFPSLPRASEFGEPKVAFTGRVYEPERLLAACMQLSRKTRGTPPAMPALMAVLTGAAAVARVAEAQPVEAMLAANASFIADAANGTTEGRPAWSGGASPQGGTHPSDRWVVSSTPTASTPAVPFAARTFDDIIAASPTAAVPSSMVLEFPAPTREGGSGTPLSVNTPPHGGSGSAWPVSPTTHTSGHHATAARLGALAGAGIGAFPLAAPGCGTLTAATNRKSFAQAAIAARDVHAPSTGMLLTRGQQHPTGTPQRNASDALVSRPATAAPAAAAAAAAPADAAAAAAAAAPAAAARSARGAAGARAPRARKDASAEAKDSAARKEGPRERREGETKDRKDASKEPKERDESKPAGDAPRARRERPEGEAARPAKEQRAPKEAASPSAAPVAQTAVPVAIAPSTSAGGARRWADIAAATAQ